MYHERKNKKRWKNQQMMKIKKKNLSRTRLVKVSTVEKQFKYVLHF